MRSTSRTDPSHWRTSRCLTNLKGVPRSLGPSQLPLLLLLARRRKRSVRNSLLVFSTLAFGHVFAVVVSLSSRIFSKNINLEWRPTLDHKPFILKPDEPLNDPEP